MSCADARRRIAAYADDELGVEAVIELEGHLERCGACRETCRQEQAWHRVVAQLYRHEPLPPGLEARIVARAAARRVRAPRVAAFVAAAVLVVVSATWRLLPDGPREPGEPRHPAFVDDAIALHGAVARGDLRVALDSTNLPAVNRWLERELPFFTPIREGARDFELRGASAVDLSGERAALVTYRRGREPVSLFVLPMRRFGSLGRETRFRGIDFHELDVRHHRVIAWSHEPVSYLLVSTLESPSGEACAVCHLGSEAAAIVGFAAAKES